MMKKAHTLCAILLGLMILIMLLPGALVFKRSSEYAPEKDYAIGGYMNTDINRYTAFTPFITLIFSVFWLGRTLIAIEWPRITRPILGAICLLLNIALLPKASPGGRLWLILALAGSAWMIQALAMMLRHQRDRNPY